MEEWKQIEKYPRYAVSNFGRVKNLLTGKVLKNRPSGRVGERYATVGLTPASGRMKNVSVHRLVAHYFMRPRVGNEQVNHLDRDKMNPHVSNLEYCTPSQNVQHSWDTGRKRLVGSLNPAAKLDADRIASMRSRYRSGERQVALGKVFGISQAQVSKIVRGESWL